MLSSYLPSWQKRCAEKKEEKTGRLMLVWSAFLTITTLNFMQHNLFYARPFNLDQLVEFLNTLERAINSVSTKQGRTLYNLVYLVYSVVLR